MLFLRKFPCDFPVWILKENRCFGRFAILARSGSWASLSCIDAWRQDEIPEHASAEDDNEEPGLHPINLRDADDNTALHVASFLAQKDIVESLLESDIFKCVCLQNSSGRTALHCAAAEGHDEVVRLLLASDRFTDEAVNAVAEEEIPVIVEAWGIHIPKQDGCTALHLAARYGHVAVTQVLLESGRFRASDAATLEGTLTALHVAAYYGHVGVVHVLLDSDRFNAVNALDAWGASAMSVAAENGHEDVVKALLRSLRFTLAPQHDWLDCFSALHVAAWKGHVEVAKVLLSDSRFPTATVNAQNRYGGTALHTAARFGHYGVVDVLLRHRRFRSADALDCMGSSALHTAAHSGHDSAVQSLLQSGPVSCMASPNTSGSDCSAFGCSARARGGHEDTFGMQPVSRLCD